jgi:hypothetical protein
MKTFIEEVQQSKTFKVYQELIKRGFQATLAKMFAQNYDASNDYLSISVRGAENRLKEFYHTTDQMEVVLVKYAYEQNPCFEVRCHREFAEFVNEVVWLEYYGEE